MHWRLFVTAALIAIFVGGCACNPAELLPKQEGEETSPDRAEDEEEVSEEEGGGEAGGVVLKTSPDLLEEGAKKKVSAGRLRLCSRSIEEGCRTERLAWKKGDLSDGLARDEHAITGSTACNKVINGCRSCWRRIRDGALQSDLKRIVCDAMEKTVRSKDESDRDGVCEPALEAMRGGDDCVGSVYRAMKVVTAK